MHEQQVVLCRKKRGVNDVVAVLDLRLDQSNMVMALLEHDHIRRNVNRIVPNYDHYSEACPRLNEAMPGYHFIAFNGKWETEHSTATDFERMIGTLQNALAMWEQFCNQFGGIVTPDADNAEDQLNRNYRWSCPD